MLSWNVIYHGTLGDVGRRLAEIWRVMKPGALYQGTMLPTRNVNYGRGRTVAPTPLSLTGRNADTRITIATQPPSFALFAGFELLSLKQQQHRQPGSWHWHIIAERRL